MGRGRWGGGFGERRGEGGKHPHYLIGKQAKITIKVPNSGSLPPFRKTGRKKEKGELKGLDFEVLKSIEGNLRGKETTGGKLFNPITQCESIESLREQGGVN